VGIRILSASKFRVKKCQNWDHCLAEAVGAGKLPVSLEVDAQLEVCVLTWC
jgi:hypothetical protein